MQKASGTFKLQTFHRSFYLSINTNATNLAYKLLFQLFRHMMITRFTQKQIQSIQPFSLP